MAAAILDCASRDEASRIAAVMAAKALEQDIRGQGFASLFVSGGSTPEGMFRMLRREALDWHRVTVGLVDERWVPPDDAESNERLVRMHLLQDKAGAAGFLPMWMPACTPDDAAAARSVAYAPHCGRASFVLLGMGLDGHTASWFSGDPALNGSMMAPASPAVVSVRAEGVCTPQRLTLSGGPVTKAKRAVLLVFGLEKRAKLNEARRVDPQTCPVRYAIDGLGDRLSIVWAE
ncbi:6-phosphogluconolactonase [Hyphomonas sp.]|uniref:6-phosphogluconolactonase n=1 Tax=Hyphomonas sp. TaxID=87 RepID=UPI00391A0BF8